jgi:predicted dienelactone hydrolase
MVRFVFIKLFCFIIVYFTLLGDKAYSSQIILITREDGQSLPLNLYGNWESSKCSNILVMSHGLGGDEHELHYIAKYLADYGFKVAVMGHKESGKNILWKFLTSFDRHSIITDKIKHKARSMDLNATIKYARKFCKSNLMIMAGHSMGAATTMVEAGAKSKIIAGGSDRFDAYIAISPQGIGWMFDEGAWNGINKPVLMITGTKDSGLDGDYKQRLIAFHQLPTGNKRLAIIENATHLNLAGLRNKIAQKQVLYVIIEFIKNIEVGGLQKTKIKDVHIVDK